MNDPHFTRLIQGHLDGTLTPEDQHELNRRLCESESARKEFWELAALHGALHETVKTLWPARPATPQEAVAPRRENRSVWLQRRPLTAAAAGLLLGLFCASVAWAYVAPSLGKAITLLQENFESEPAQVGGGVPIEAGIWSGDFAEIVGEQQGVKPTSGKKMLRFLRGDYEGRNIPSSHSSDVFRLVDVRPFRREFADGGAVVQLSAVFNAAQFPADETFHCTLTLFALDAGMAGNGSLKEDLALSTDSLAYSRSSKVAVDRDTATWQKVSNELRLPPGTDYLMLRMGMSNDTKSPDKRRDSFPGHFADKVQLVIARRAEISVP